VAEFHRKRAILIGADKYDHLNPLAYCGLDVRDVGVAFRSSLQFKNEDILEFRLGGALAPKRNDILHTMAQFLKNGVEEDDLLVFYFSGHGAIDQKDQKDYLLPVDASPADVSGTGIQVELFADRLTATGCKNIVMFIDACRESISGAKGITSVGQNSQEALQRGGIVTFFSCDPKEKSYEIEDLKHGSFTHCVLNAIANGTCDTVESIDKYLRENVPLLNARYHKPPQRPFTIIQPAEKGQLAIFLRQLSQQHPETGAYAVLFEKLGELMYSQELEEKHFDEAVEFLVKAQASASLSEVDNRRLRFIESLCQGKLRSRSFEVIWKEAARREPVAPPKLF
jgi:hypothetical protein